jgi:hypothetical protein
MKGHPHTQAESWDDHWSEQGRRMRRLRRKKWMRRLSIMAYLFCAVFVGWLLFLYLR